MESLIFVELTLLCELMTASFIFQYCFQDKYNTSQSRAINTVEKISKLPDNLARVVLLQGPPGTGKSHTTIGVIKRIVQVNSNFLENRKKMLMVFCLYVTSYQHSIMDEMNVQINGSVQH